VFAADWYFAVGEELTAAGYYPPPEQLGDELVQIVASGPDQAVNAMHEMYFAAICAARERVWIETCYFVPPQSILTALITAAHRGVDVRIIVPKRSAHLLPLVAAHSYYEELLGAGVSIYEYHKGLMHAKTMIVDGCWSTVGSTNVDVRSLELNFEVGAVFYGSSMAKRIEETFEQDLSRSVAVDPDRWQQRGLVKRLTENTCRLLSPML
jgi:cardiolipin synthase